MEKLLRPETFGLMRWAHIELEVLEYKGSHYSSIMKIGHKRSGSITSRVSIGSPMILSDGTIIDRIMSIENGEDGLLIKTNSSTFRVIFPKFKVTHICDGGLLEWRQGKRRVSFIDEDDDGNYHVCHSFDCVNKEMIEHLEQIGKIKRINLFKPEIRKEQFQTVWVDSVGAVFFLSPPINFELVGKI